VHALADPDLDWRVCYQSRATPQRWIGPSTDDVIREAGQEGGRVMAISLHPWIIGQPYRIRALEEALDHILRHAGVWSATGAEILDAWSASQGEA
jgi:peptidoglycan/xylan/chitin deacetylase (PgdA/CDA1 family)